MAGFFCGFVVKSRAVDRPETQVTLLGHLRQKVGRAEITISGKNPQPPPQVRTLPACGQGNKDELISADTPQYHSTHATWESEHRRLHDACRPRFRRVRTRTQPPLCALPRRRLLLLRSRRAWPSTTAGRARRARRPSPSAERRTRVRSPLCAALTADILKDGMDPDFMAKLQRLGPVAIDDPSRIVRTVSPTLLN